MTLIAHLSDLHLEPVPFPRDRPFRLKPVLGWINWARQKGAHDNGRAAATAEAVRAAAPDAVVVAGDLVELSRPEEYDAAGAALAKLGDPCRVLWAPGNHDVYTAEAAERIRATLADWLAPAGDAPQGDLRAHFPRLDIIGRAGLVTLCSGRPTWLFSAEGELGSAQLGRLDTMLAGLDRAGRLPVIAVHHPPHAPGLSPLKRLRDGAALLELLARHRCPLILHGHLHRSLRQEWRRDGHAILLVGAASASATGRRGEPASFNLLRIDEDLRFSVETRHAAEGLRSD